MTIGATATNAKSRVPVVSGLGVQFFPLAQTSFLPTTKATTRIHSFVGRVERRWLAT